MHDDFCFVLFVYLFVLVCVVLPCFFFFPLFVASCSEDLLNLSPLMRNSYLEPLLRPRLYGLGCPRQPSVPKQLYREFMREKCVCWLFIKLFNVQIPRYLSSFEFLSFIRSVWALLSLVCFCNVNLCFKAWNFENTWHSARRELSRVGEPKSLCEKKLSHLPGLLYLPRRDSAPTGVSRHPLLPPPRQLGEDHINRATF